MCGGILKEKDGEDAPCQTALFHSYETLKASENPSVNSVPREFPPGTSSESGVRKDLPDYSSFTGAKMLGKGLQNKAAESNCFLNVIIQARKVRISDVFHMISFNLTIH